MAPLFEPSRANELLLIDSACFESCFCLVDEYINELCHGMPDKKYSLLFWSMKCQSCYYAKSAVLTRNAGKRLYPRAYQEVM
jgi:hypothetical protein